MERQKDCTRWLTQPTLIKQILKTVGISETKPPDKRVIRTPATKVLHKDIGGLLRRTIDRLWECSIGLPGPQDHSSSSPLHRSDASWHFQRNRMKTPSYESVNISVTHKTKVC
jgi:hypothetical protein